MISNYQYDREIDQLLRDIDSGCEALDYAFPILEELKKDEEALSKNETHVNILSEKYAGLLCDCRSTENGFLSSFPDFSPGLNSLDSTLNVEEGLLFIGKIFKKIWEWIKKVVKWIVNMFKRILSIFSKRLNVPYVADVGGIIRLLEKHSSLKNITLNNLIEDQDNADKKASIFLYFARLLGKPNIDSTCVNLINSVFIPYANDLKATIEESNRAFEKVEFPIYGYKRVIDKIDGEHWLKKFQESLKSVLSKSHSKIKTTALMPKNGFYSTVIDTIFDRKNGEFYLKNPDQLKITVEGLNLIEYPYQLLYKVRESFFTLLKEDIATQAKKDESIKGLNAEWGLRIVENNKRFNFELIEKQVISDDHDRVEGNIYQSIEAFIKGGGMLKVVDNLHKGSACMFPKFQKETIIVKLLVFLKATVNQHAGIDIELGHPDELKTNPFEMDSLGVYLSSLTFPCIVEFNVDLKDSNNQTILGDSRPLVSYLKEYHEEWYNPNLTRSFHRASSDAEVSLYEIEKLIERISRDSEKNSVISAIASSIFIPSLKNLSNLMKAFMSTFKENYDQQTYVQELIQDVYDYLKKNDNATYIKYYGNRGYKVSETSDWKKDHPGEEI